MKAFLAALVVMAVISVGADVVLDQLGSTAAEQGTTAHVRLGD